MRRKEAQPDAGLPTNNCLLYTSPILFLTARIEDTDKVKGFTVGGDDYIVKPFSLVELLSQSPGPVSYTHLDVYKRQPLCDPKSKTAQQGPVSPLWTVDWGKAAPCKTAGAAGHRGVSAKTARRFSGVSEVNQKKEKNQDFCFES